MNKVKATIEYLRRRQEYRKAGGRVAFTTDPAWLVQMAINRRAGWPDDPSTTRGSAMPVNGKYPLRASGGHGYDSLRLLAHRVNTPRLIVREQEIPLRFRVRLSHRIYLGDL